MQSRVGAKARPRPLTISCVDLPLLYFVKEFLRVASTLNRSLGANALFDAAPAPAMLLHCINKPRVLCFAPALAWAAQCVALARLWQGDGGGSDAVLWSN